MQYSMTIAFNIWMICLKLNRFFYGLSRMLHLSQFVWTPCYSVWDVFNNFLLIEATDRSKISSDQKHLFSALSLYPLSFFANTPFKLKSKSLFYLVLLLLWFGYWSRFVCFFPNQFWFGWNWPEPVSLEGSDSTLAGLESTTGVARS